MTSQPDQDQKIIAAGILLQRYLASGSAEVERVRDQLVQECLLPLIRTILRRKLGVDITGSGRQQGAREEVAQEVYGKILIALLRQMERWHTGEAVAPLPEKFLGYVASAAYNACKNAYPRLQNMAGASQDASFQVYYLLTRQAGFALWQMEVGLLCGGYAVWKQAALPEASASLRDDLQRDPEGFALQGLRRRSPGKRLRDCTSIELLMALLDQAGMPLEFSALVSAFSALAKAIGTPIHEVSLSLPGRQGEAERDLVAELDAHSDVEQTIADRGLLRQLWEQVLRLPARQRKALLLNLPDADIRLLPEMGVVGFGEIALALEKTPAELAQIWNTLPLDDTVIAQELDTTAPKVKNLRQSAYDTLSWRMRPFRRGALRRLWLAVIRLPHPLAVIYMLYARDSQGASLLVLQQREDYVTWDEIVEQLLISLEDLKRVWPELPLRFDQIAMLLKQPTPTVVHWYIRACEQLQAHLAEIRGES